MSSDSVKSDNPYKVCILAAGRGSRLGGLTNIVNKAMVPVGYKPVLSHIIEKVSAEIPIVIAVGYLKETIEEFVDLCYPDRDISLVEVDKFEGPLTGPGYSLFQCKDYLDCPFVVTTCDTLVLEKIPQPEFNWMGVAPSEQIEKFCSVVVDNEKIVKILYKEHNPGGSVFIGIAGIKDHIKFWDSLEHNQEVLDGEIQLANGLAGVIGDSLWPVNFSWFDTGDNESLKNTRDHFGGAKNLDKDSECIYFVGPDVVKFFPNPDWVSKRVQRAKILGALCPSIDGLTEHYYKYRKVPGEELSGIVNDQLCLELLSWCSDNLWRPIDLSIEDSRRFQRVCREFYKDKTFDRLEQFYQSRGLEDQEETINGVRVPLLSELLASVHWDGLSRGIPVVFHGDLHFDNIIVASDRTREHQFCLLDWRQDFGGIVEYGDMYYDLSKMYHALNISHEAIKTDRFSVTRSKDTIQYDHWVNNRLLSCKDIFENHVVKQGLDLQKVKLLTNIIFLNMSPLHQHPFDLMLYYMGKLGLHKLAQSKNNTEIDRSSVDG